MTGTAGRPIAARLAGPFVVILATAGTALVYRIGYDFRNGQAEPTDGLALAAAFLILGLYTEALPALWRRFDGGLVAPIYIVLTLIYMYCACRMGFVQPGATAAAVLGHVVVVVFLLLNGD